jgi:hypothetical protein
MASESKTQMDFMEPKFAQGLDEDLDILAALPVVKRSPSHHEFPEDGLAAWATAFGS